MHETTHKYKLLVHFSKAKQPYYTFTTIHHSNVFTFLQINPHLSYFTYKVDKNANNWKIYPQAEIINSSAARNALDN